MGCHICKGTGYTLKKGVMVRCKCREERILRFLFLRAGIGEQFHNLAWDNFNTNTDKRMKALKSVKAKTKELQEKKFAKKSLCIIGGDQSGKTALASMMLMSLIREGFDCKIVPLYTLIDASFQKDMPEKDLGFYNHNKYDVLCIELGQEGVNKRSGYVLEHYYYGRRAREKFTFFTSRLIFGKMNLVYGVSAKRIFNRLQIEDIIL